MSGNYSVKIFKDNQNLDTQAVIFAIWHNRNDYEEVNKYCAILCQFVDEKYVFDEVEFYFPQIAHMIIHLEVEWSTTHLEKYAIMLCQTSFHLALQFTYILYAAMEDYQPEDISGSKNPKFNEKLFSRCTRLLRGVERAVVFGLPTLYNFDEEYSASKISESVKSVIEDIQRNKRATEIISENIEDNNGGRQLCGMLHFKRGTRRPFHLKRWKPRWFKIQQQILLCYHDSNYKELLRAIPLQGCEVIIDQNKRYQNYFEVYSPSSRNRFRLYAANPKEFNDWVEAIKRESCRIPETNSFDNNSLMVERANTDGDATLSADSIALNLSDNSSTVVPETPTDSMDDNITTTQMNSLATNMLTGGGGNHTESLQGMGHSMKSLLRTVGADIQSAIGKGNLSDKQIRRHMFYRQQIKFVSDLTDICERLRFLEKEVRKDELRRELKEMMIPPGCYLPLCNSTDPWCTVRCVLPEECHAFTTKARCPALVLFESEMHPRKLDVASYLASEFQFDDSPLIELKTPVSFRSTGNNSNGGMDDDDPNSPSFILEKRNDNAVWITKGVGIRRVLSKLSDPGILPSTSSQEIETLAKSMSDSEAMLNDEKSNEELQERKTSTKFVLTAAMSTASTAGVDGNTTSINMKFGNMNDLNSSTEDSVLSPSVFGETFTAKSERIKKVSVFSELSGWVLQGLIAKSNDDLRQEVLVMQLITYYQKIFRAASLPLWLYSYRILSTSKSTGLIQLIPDAISLDGLKKRHDWPGSLRAHFEKSYGNPESSEFQTAIRRYMCSLAGYSVVTYLLAIKDRHNGNIMLDTSGHLIHIDFGFVFGLAPGKQFSMEKAPWKLTVEMVEVMGGRSSSLYSEYLTMVTEGLREARKHMSAVCCLIQIMIMSSNFPAFRYNPNAIADFRQRLLLSVEDRDLLAEVTKMASRSYNHSGSNAYDSFQVR